ncbi:hypothetical protein AAVH_25265 [Aphelenchoides avenae]|nr:hypothetical protein AAVH_25265 [Aphelenchus avenae]
MVAGNYNKPKDCLVQLVQNGCSFKAKEISTGGEFGTHFEAGASYAMSLHGGIVRFYDKRAAKMVYSFPRTHLLIITRRGGTFRLERTGAAGSYVVVAPKADADHDFLVDEQEKIVRVRSLFVLLEPLYLTEQMGCSLFSIVERAIQDPFTLAYVNEAFTMQDHQISNVGALFECVDLARRKWPKAHRTQTIFVILKTKHALGWCDGPPQHAGTCNCGQNAALLEVAKAFDNIVLKVRYDNHMHDRHVK